MSAWLQRPSRSLYLRMDADSWLQTSSTLNAIFTSSARKRAMPQTGESGGNGG